MSTRATADYSDCACPVNDMMVSSLSTSDLGQGLTCNIRPGFRNVLTHPLDALLSSRLSELPQLPQHNLPKIGSYGIAVRQDVLDEVLEESQKVETYLL